MSTGLPFFLCWATTSSTPRSMALYSSSMSRGGTRTSTPKDLATACSTSSFLWYGMPTKMHCLGSMPSCL